MRWGSVGVSRGNVAKIRRFSDVAVFCGVGLGCVKGSTGNVAIISGKSGPQHGIAINRKWDLSLEKGWLNYLPSLEISDDNYSDHYIQHANGRDAVFLRECDNNRPTNGSFQNSKYLLFGSQ